MGVGHVNDNSGKVQSVAIFVFHVILGRGNPLNKRLLIIS